MNRLCDISGLLPLKVIELRLYHLILGLILTLDRILPALTVDGNGGCCLCECLIVGRFGGGCAFFSTSHYGLCSCSLSVTLTDTLLYTIDGGNCVSSLCSVLIIAAVIPISVG